MEEMGWKPVQQKDDFDQSITRLLSRNAKIARQPCWIFRRTPVEATRMLSSFSFGWWLK
jgi:hypothetical protein